MTRAIIIAGCLLPLAEMKTFRYNVIGDFGMGGWDSGMMFEVESANRFHDMSQEYDGQFTISTGDNIYNADVQYGLKKSFEELWAKDGVHTGGLWLLTQGNHGDHGSQVQYSKKNPKWYLPTNYFTRVMDTGLGFNIQVWGVDTHQFDAHQSGWLENSLKDSKARWKVIFTHYPYASSGRHARVAPPATVAALAKKFGVQAVFNGHDHLIQTCVEHGVAFVGSGAVSRGSMMNRAIDAQKNHFVLTVGTHTSIGTHGIFEAIVSKNVMWGVTLSRNGLVHEFNTVWDWPFKYRDLSKGDNALPSPKVVLQYLNEEADSTKPESQKADGPAASTDANSTATNSSAVEKKPDVPETPSPTNNINITKVTLNPNLTAQVAPKAPTAVGVIPEKLAKFVVSTNCRECTAGISVGREFSLWIQGIKITKDHRVFIAYSDSDCHKDGVEAAVAGGKVVIPRSPIINWTLRGKLSGPTHLFVCLSGNAGEVYYSLGQSGVLKAGFTAYPEPPESSPTPPGQKTKAVKRPQVGSFSMKTSASTGSIPKSWFYILTAIIITAVPMAWQMGKKARSRELRDNSKRHQSSIKVAT